MLRLACVLLILLAACDREPTAGAGRGIDESEVIARIDGQPITRSDLQRRMSQLSPFVQARYGSPERRKELLDNFIRLEVLAREAKRRGYDRDPVVVRQQQQRLVERMLAEEVDRTGKPEDIPEDEVRRHYQAHPERFTRPEAVRVSQILVDVAATAAEVAAAARALGPKDEAGFRKLVAAHSRDEDSKQRGGDLTFLERPAAGAAPQQPREVIEAAFALTEPGQIAGPIQSARGYHVLRLSERRPAALRAFEEVKAEARAQVLEQRRSRLVDEWVAEMRNKVKVEVYEDKLREVAAKP